MRALHFCFLMHHPYELNLSGKWERGYFGGEKSFRQADEEEYQPLLALLERNAQRYSKIKVSLAISGVWIEQAERWNADLLKRVKKLVQNGNVELVVLPYYYSVAAFFEMEEFAAQVKQMQTKLEQVFDCKSTALALPECCYHNKIAQWAQKNGFEVVLAGEARKSLAWRSANEVFLARGCESVRVLCQNTKLTQILVEANERVFKAEIFQKQLDLEMLRGKLINIYLSTQILAKWRDAGIVGFFDELFRIWQETPGRKLVGVAECAKAPVEAELSVKLTASSLGEAKREYALPEYWQNMEIDRQRRLYDLREKVLETRDKDLYVDFARLTARDYAKGGAAYEEVFEDIRAKTAKFTHDRLADNQPAKKGMTASTKVKINFDRKAQETKRRKEELLRLFREVNAGDEVDRAVWEGADMDDMEAAIQVLAQRMRQNPDTQHAYDNLAEAEVVQGDVWMEQEVVLGDEDVEEVELDDEEMADDVEFSELEDEMGDFEQSEDTGEEVSEAEIIEVEPQVTKSTKRKKKIVID